MPILRRNCLKERPDNEPTSSSSTVRVPSVSGIILLMSRMSVDLPAPLKPMMAINSPCSIVRLTCDNAIVPFGYVFPTLLNVIIDTPLKNKAQGTTLSLIIRGKSRRLSD